MAASSHARFDELWAHHRELLAFIRRRTEPDIAEDVLAETYLVAWRRIDEVPSEERPWLFTVARNIIRNNYRAAARRRDTAVRIAEGIVPDDGIEGAIATRADLVTAWKRLTAGEQEVLGMVAWDDLSHREAAQVLSISSSAFAVRLFRARRRLLHLIEHGRGETT
ncbi:sigma-70 family RNA polymerase sigma factor [Pseudactinotalea sp. HY160]|uniref:RNA polymerase sigma factor n=1 Tax=Pseudactinotalea sp. HY160 TaxID=2654490 RepID=UPI00128BDB66|nr:sigma-70 family RNA polymerase sigma factor [Pseudactinotalea sp. HY160]MPV49649.1 sigma-70 family RNA polymerase sigma factor [Pseudactinotalea sp. HY160]